MCPHLQHSQQSQQSLCPLRPIEDGEDVVEPQWEIRVALTEAINVEVFDSIEQQVIDEGLADGWRDGRLNVGRMPLRNEQALHESITDYVEALPSDRSSDP